MNFYNEINPDSASWLRELVKAGHIAPGVVDERSIEDIAPDELREYTQCHFFAGIGVWSYTLRKAGWPDDRPVWTGSCPCQPFSAAGKRKGTSDERHLWPAWFHLIHECRPPVIFGEQVEAAIRQGWLDLVSDDLEGIGYSIGSAGIPACGVGAPHIRKRLYFVAHSLQSGRSEGWSESRDRQTSGCGGSGWMDDSSGSRHNGEIGESEGDPRNEARMRVLSEPSEIGSMADAGRVGRERWEGSEIGHEPYGTDAGRIESNGRSTCCGENADDLPDTGPTNGFWRSSDWLLCRDGKFRPVEPGTFPLAYGASARVGRLRGYGNAIVAPLAQAFIEAAIEAIEETTNGNPQTVR